MKSIPASKLVNVNPGVLGTGGNPLSLNAFFITQSPLVPIGIGLSFGGVQDVQDFFGVDSDEARMAGIYFSGFTNATALPSTLWFVQYAAADVAGYLRSGSFDGVPLSALQSLTGTLILSVDGRQLTTGAINLASATSFSNAATLVQTGLRAAGTAFTGTATTTDMSATLQVDTTTSGELLIGDTIVGVGIPAATTITAYGSYTPEAGSGTVTMSAQATATAGSPEAVTVAGPAVVVSYNSTLQAFVIQSPTTGADSSVSFSTGTLAAGLKLTQATGAVRSPGAAAMTPADVFAIMVGATQNWATFATTWEPSIDEQVAFATQANTASPAGKERFAYVGETTDITLTEGPAPDSFPGQTAAFNGRIAVYSQASTTLDDGTVVGDAYGNAAAFVCGTIASINWGAVNGRITLAYKGNSQLNPSVVDLTISDNLDANGTNYYASFATANQGFLEFQNGQISGAWDWIDQYVDQIYLNSQFQLALMTFLQTINAVPYNNAGYGLIRAALQPPITEALTNGSIVSGVELSAAQIAAANAQAGLDISGPLFAQGWYLQVLDPGAQVRGNRGSPIMTFWYTDGGAIQSINLASIDIQ